MNPKIEKYLDDIDDAYNISEQLFHQVADLYEALMACDREIEDGDDKIMLQVLMKCAPDIINKVSVACDKLFIRTMDRGKLNLMYELKQQIDKVKELKKDETGDK